MYYFISFWCWTNSKMREKESLECGKMYIWALKTQKLPWPQMFHSAHTTLLCQISINLASEAGTPPAKSWIRTWGMFTLKRQLWSLYWAEWAVDPFAPKFYFSWYKIILVQFCGDGLNFVAYEHPFSTVNYCIRNANEQKIAKFFIFILFALVKTNRDLSARKRNSTSPSIGTSKDGPPPPISRSNFMLFSEKFLPNKYAFE